jgi:nucleotide-binding universal stress UspA family protein
MMAENVSCPAAASTEDLCSFGKFSSLSPSRPTTNILVALDLSSPSVRLIQTAVRFATTLHSNLFVAHVFEYSNSGIVEGVIGLQEESRRRLDNIVQKIHSENIVAQSVIRYGPAAPTILKIIKDKNIDLAILGTNNTAGMERFVFGSVAEAVFRSAPCPMLTIGPKATLDQTTHTQGPIVFATDLNTRLFHAIRYAAFLSKAFGAPLHCIQVLPPSLDTHGVPIISAIMTGALTHLIEENGLHEQCICSNVYGDNISETIVEYAKERKAELIVLGIHRTSTLVSHLPPHITYEIVAGASCPVLTVSS